MANRIDCVEIRDEMETRRFLRENPHQWDYIDEGIMSKAPEPVAVVFYISQTPANRETIATIKSGLKNLKDNFDQPIDFSLGSLELIIEVKDDALWLNEWKKYYKPFHVGKRIVVRPEWEPYTPTSEDEIVLTMNPGHVFGTGLHETTQLCMEILERYVSCGDLLLDLGCGSGILSILATQLGAASAFACDLEPDSATIAYANARLNNIGSDLYKVCVGNVLTDESLREQIRACGKYDIVTANIVADVIIGLADFVPSCLRSGGIFITSGIISTRLSDVQAALEENKFILLETFVKKDWYALVARYA
jgi:ribosomal protein L11 methyltransferase